MDLISKVITVEVSQEKAFKKFLYDFNEWWPKEYTWSQDKLKEIRIEPKKDGLCMEFGPNEFRCDWGRVTDLVKYEKIELKWQIGPNREPVPDPEKASLIVIKFQENGKSSSKLELEHRNFENHGEGAENYLKVMDDKQGWDYILDCFRKYCEN